MACSARWTGVFLLTLSTAACSSNGGAGGDATGSLGTCGARVEATGAANLKLTGQDDAACLTQHSFDSGLDVSFIHVDAQGTSKGSLELAIAEVTEGATGADFPTRVMVSSDALERWQSNACLTSITEHRLVRTEDSMIGELRHYQVGGEGACDAALEPSSGGGSVTLGPYEFSAELVWRD
jgi:hypothetical protein